MSVTRVYSKRKPTYIALQIPLEGKIWVEAGHFNAYRQAFDSFERNDTSTLVFSVPQSAKLVGKALNTLDSLEN